jgi:hypothetical protein
LRIAPTDVASLFAEMDRRSGRLDVVLGQADAKRKG